MGALRGGHIEFQGSSEGKGSMDTQMDLRLYTREDESFGMERGTDHLIGLYRELTLSRHSNQKILLKEWILINRELGGIRKRRVGPHTPSPGPLSSWHFRSFRGLETGDWGREPPGDGREVKSLRGRRELGQERSQFSSGWGWEGPSPSPSKSRRTFKWGTVERVLLNVNFSCEPLPRTGRHVSNRKSSGPVSAVHPSTVDTLPSPSNRTPLSHTWSQPDPAPSPTHPSCSEKTDVMGVEGKRVNKVVLKGRTEQKPVKDVGRTRQGFDRVRGKVMEEGLIKNDTGQGTGPGFSEPDGKGTGT